MVLPLISVGGPPAQAGEAYGNEARQMIEQNLDVYLRRFSDQAGLDAAAVTKAGQAFRAATVTHHPRIAAMLDGVAAGAGVSRSQIYALNARTELLYGHHMSGDEGCTAIGVLGTHTATGHLLLGQNWDWHPDQRETMLLLRTTDEHGHAVLTLAEAGMLAKTGLNSAGVGQCLTMLASERDGLTDPPGVPYHVLARATLEADCLTWATRAACRSPRNASINLMLGQAGDPAHGDPAVGGEMLDLELVPGDVGLLHPNGGMVTHANHLEAVTGVHDMQRDWGGSSLFRAARARRLLSDVVAAGKTTTDDLASVFRDHASFPHAICRHVDDRDTALERSQTVFSVVMDLDARRFGITPGPPCGHAYAWYDVTKAAPAPLLRRLLERDGHDEV
jgi:isopenicillin-N N-acyltransferase like protein